MSLFEQHAVQLNDDPAPEYRVALTRSNTATTSGSGSSNVHWQSPFADPPAPVNSPRRLPRAKPERYLYTYNLVAGSAPLQFLISVEPSNGRPTPGKYAFRLSLQVDKVERPMGDPVSLHLAVDPRLLEFVVFVFPGKTSLPVDTLYSYRVWLRVNGIEHRLFGEDELWIARDPDFSSIANASFARLKTISTNTQIYDAYVGKARIQFVARWRLISEDLYKYTLEYDANGVGGVLIEDFRLILHGDPRKATFLIYTVPMQSAPEGASHRVRVWLKTYSSAPVDPTSTFSLPFSDSYVYQRIWKSDSFKIGAQLDFGSLANRKMVMGFSVGGGPKTIVMSQTGGGDLRYLDKNTVLEVG
ncbi:hypothetical protein C8J56DRAFT_149924 [Mycena floridula]|nr:hypothetical protein C8J56DRAFT_149924 [Mycena floridula]